MGSHPANEPILNYAPGSAERGELQAELKRQMGEIVEIPCIIDGEEIFTGNTMTQVIPHNHGHIIANVHLAGRAEIEAGVRRVALVDSRCVAPMRRAARGRSN